MIFISMAELKDENFQNLQNFDFCQFKVFTCNKNKTLYFKNMSKFQEKLSFLDIFLAWQNNL